MLGLVNASFLFMLNWNPIYLFIYFILVGYLIILNSQSNFFLSKKCTQQTWLGANLHFFSFFFSQSLNQAFETNDSIHKDL